MQKTFGNEIGMCSPLSRKNETTNVQMKMYVCSPVFMSKNVDLIMKND